MHVRSKIASGSYEYRSHFINRAFIGTGWKVETGGRVVAYRDTLTDACSFVDNWFNERKV